MNLFKAMHNPMKFLRLMVILVALAIEIFLHDPIVKLWNLCRDYGTVRVLSSPQAPLIVFTLAGFMTMGILFQILAHVDWQKPGADGCRESAHKRAKTAIPTM